MSDNKLDTDSGLEREAMTFINNADRNNTQYNRKTDIKQFLEWDAPQAHEDLKPTEVMRYFKELINDGHAEASVRVTFWNVKAFYDFLKADRMIDESPFEDDYLQARKVGSANASKKSRKLKEDAGFAYLSPEEVKMMLNHASEAQGSPLRNDLVIRLLFVTGARIGEFINIELDDLDRDARTVQLFATKTKESRTVEYRPSQTLDTHLDQWINIERDSLMGATDSSYLFPSKESERISDRTVSKIVTEAAWAVTDDEDCPDIQDSYQDVGGKPRNRITPHTLRHSYAMAMLNNGADSRYIQKSMGHSSIETTQRYLDASNEDVREVQRKQGPQLE